MIITTTGTVEGHRITDYRGIVVGEAIMGANVFRDFFAQITDVVGGRSGAYESKLQDARETALRELEERARGGGQCGDRSRSGLRGGGRLDADGLGLWNSGGVGVI